MSAIPQHRIYASAASFSSGAALMSLELAAARLLAAHFGNTLYTWTAVIGALLVAMSAGAYAGGSAADRYRGMPLLRSVFAGAAAATILVPLTGSLVARAAASWFPGVVLGPMMAAIGLFLLPGFFFGAIQPVSLRVYHGDRGSSGLGQAAGVLGMMSTLGSVVGTFGAGFVLIPHLGLRSLFLSLGLVLALLAAIPEMGRRRQLSPAYAAVAVALPVGLLWPSPALPPGVLYDEHTRYQHLRVERQASPGAPPLLVMFQDTEIHGMEYEDHATSPVPVMNSLAATRAFTPGGRRALVLGGGTYTGPKVLARDLGFSVDVVELDPAVAECAERFFGLDDRTLQIRTSLGDARQALQSTPARYDVIFGDAFRGIYTVPAHLLTREFFAIVKRHLTEDGVFVINIGSALRGPQSILFQSVVRTLREVFAEAYVVRPFHGFPDTVPQNVFIVAPRDARGLTDQELEERLGAVPLPIAPESLSRADAYAVTEGSLFTDDRNPSEWIVARQLLDDPRRARH